MLFRSIHLDIKKLGRFERVGHRIPPSHGLPCNPLPGNGRPHRSEQRPRGQLGSSHGPPLVRGALNCSPLVQEQWRAARVHICIDDAARVAVTGIFPDEKAVSAIAAEAAVAYYQSLGIPVTRVMTEFEGSGHDPGDHFPAEPVVL